MEAPCGEDAGRGAGGEGEGYTLVLRRSRGGHGRREGGGRGRGKGAVKEKVDAAYGCVDIEGMLVVLVVVIAGVCL